MSNRYWGTVVLCCCSILWSPRICCSISWNNRDVGAPMTPLTHSALQRYRLVVAEWSCPTASPFYIYESANPVLSGSTCLLTSFYLHMIGHKCNSGLISKPYWSPVMPLLDHCLAFFFFVLWHFHFDGLYRREKNKIDGDRQQMTRVSFKPKTLPLHRMHLYWSKLPGWELYSNFPSEVLDTKAKRKHPSPPRDTS